MDLKLRTAADFSQTGAVQSQSWWEENNLQSGLLPCPRVSMRDVTTSGHGRKLTLSNCGMYDEALIHDPLGLIQ